MLDVTLPEVAGLLVLATTPRAERVALCNRLFPDPAAISKLAKNLLDEILPKPPDSGVTAELRPAPFDPNPLYEQKDVHVGLSFKTDKYSYRPYFVNEDRILLKQTIFRCGRYVLLADKHGKHYEEHVNRHDAQARMEAEERAFRGELGGNKPR